MPQSTTKLYTNPSTIAMPPQTGWQVASGAAPAPTVTLTCGGGGDGGGCTLAATLKIQDLGGGAYSLEAVEISGGGSNLTLRATRNGTLLTNDADNPLRAVFYVATGEEVAIAAMLIDNDSGCIVNFAREKVANSDSNTGAPQLPPPKPELSSDCTQNLRVYYRDPVQWSQEREGMEVWAASFGISALLECPNPGCLEWAQIAFRSDATLDGIYTDATWDAHQLGTLKQGARYDAQGERPAQSRRYANVVLDEPGAVVRARLKFTPVYEMWALPTGATSVAKIREIEAGKMFIFATGPALTFTYSAAASELPRAGVLSPLKTLGDYNATDATDAAILGDKLYIVRPGELFFIDLDSGQISMNYTPRGETRAPKFVETVGGSAFAVFVDAGLSSGKTRCYDLTFGAPKLVWQIDDSVTMVSPVDGDLWIKSGSKLYISSGGSGAAVLAFTFPAAITALSADYVGLNNGAVYRLVDGAWTLRVTLASAISALSKWHGDGDAETALAGLATDLLHRELPNGNWSEDRQLIVPATLAPATVAGAVSMALYSKELAAADEFNPAQNDERQLIGTMASGLLFVYRLSDLSEEKGAFKAWRTFAPALMPLYRPIVETE